MEAYLFTVFVDFLKDWFLFYLDLSANKKVLQSVDFCKHRHWVGCHIFLALVLPKW